MKKEQKKQIEYNENGTEIIRMGISDFNRLKDFIIEQYNTLECKDFFIIEDIDTELPIILKNGIVISIVKNNQILGLQAIDLNKKNSSNLKEILNPTGDSNLEFYELGWTLIHNEYREKGFATKLLKQICSYLNFVSEFILVATVHPLNNAAFKLYSNFGFRAMFQTKYYGYDRILMVKEIHKEK